MCPACRASGRPPGALELGTIVRIEGDDVREGALICSEALCQREHPILDGIPVVVADLRSWASHQLPAALRRDDLSAFSTSLLGDAAGPGSAFDQERATLSTYAVAHWGDAASLAQLFARALGLLDAPPNGMWIDLGCAVGRATRDLALRTGELGVGVDLNFSMLRLAEQLRSSGHAEFDRRRVGLVYDRIALDVAEMPAERMSFWCCDVANLPFPDGLFAGALSLNLVDCVGSPIAHLLEMARVLGAGADALLSTPYDWSPNASPVEQWLGGHSQRGPRGGSSAAELRRVMEAVPIPFQIEAEQEQVPWRVYVHERASMDYAVHLLHLRRDSLDRPRS